MQIISPKTQDGEKIEEKEDAAALCFTRDRLMHGRGDDNEEADDLTDLLAAILKLAVGPEVGNRLEVVKKLLAVAEDVSSLTDEDLEDLAGANIADNIANGRLEARQTASIHGLTDGLDSISKLKKSTLDGLNAQLLDASLEIRPGSIHLTDDNIKVTGAARGIAHAGAHTLSDTTDEQKHIVGRRSNSDLSVILIDKDAKDFSDIRTSSIEVTILPLSCNVLEELDELTTMREDVHDLVLDESHDLTVPDLLDDLDDRISSLLNAASPEGISNLLNTVGKGEEALHDGLNAEGLDTVSDELNTVVEVSSHVRKVPDASSGITHHNVEAISDTLEEVENILLGLEPAVLIEISSALDDETCLIDCAG